MSFNTKVSQAKEYEVQINIIPGSKYEDIDSLAGIEFYLFRIPDHKIIQSGMSKYEINDFLDTKSLKDLKASDYILETITEPTSSSGQTKAKIENMGYYYIYSSNRDDMQLIKPFTHFALENGNINIPVINIKRTMEVFDINIEKKWVGGVSNPIKVKLIPNGLKKLSREFTIGKSTRWIYRIEDLPIYDKEGKKIVYWIGEDLPAGYKVDYKVESSQKEENTKYSRDSGLVQYPYNQVTITNTKVKDIVDPEDKPGKEDLAPDGGDKDDWKDEDEWRDRVQTEVKTGDRGPTSYLLLIVLALGLVLQIRKRKNHGKRG